jgi:predicted class III extradiol MEMO1 family dioxygenase
MKKTVAPVLIIFVCATINLAANNNETPAEDTNRIPLIYSTDLFHPPEDPDDHFDWAILASIKEFDLKAVIFDISTAWRNENEAATGALQQMFEKTPFEIKFYEKNISNRDCGNFVT